MGLRRGEMAAVATETPAAALGEGDGSVGEKHPLENNWTLWFDNPNGRQKQATWGQTLRQVYTFGTVEDFWCLYNNIVPPSKLINGADFHLFKEGIEPKWEDPRCSQGGKWSVSFPKANKQLLDQGWLNTVSSIALFSPPHLSYSLLVSDRVICFLYTSANLTPSSSQ